MEKHVFQMSEIHFKKAYKTNGILTLFEPKSEKWPQKHCKSIGYRRFSQRVFQTPKTYNPNGKSIFAKAKKSDSKKLIKRMEF